MTQELNEQKIHLTNKHYLTMTSLLAILVWLVSTTYLLVNHLQVVPLTDKVSELNHRLEKESTAADLYKVKVEQLHDDYLRVLQQHDQPILLHPSNEDAIISTQLDFEWDYKNHNPHQRYILELRNLDTQKTYRFNVTNPALKSMHVPVKRVGFGKFLWRIVPGHRAGQLEVVQGASSDFALFRVFPSLWEKVLTTREVIVGTNPRISGSFSILSADNKIIGFDIELIRWIMEEISRKENLDPAIKVSFVSLPWSKMLPKLKKRELDMIISNMTATKEREETFDVNFSVGYFQTHEIFGVKNPPAEAFPAGLKGRVVGAVAATTNERSAQYLADIYGFELKSHYASGADMFRALESSEVDFVVSDKTQLLEEVKSQRFHFYGPHLDEVLEPFYRDIFGSEEQVYGIALHREREDGLLERINDILLSNKGRAKIKFLEEKWIWDE